MHELIQKTAVELRALLKSRKISPSDLLDALEVRINDVDSNVNALPTLCFERAQQHAREIDDGLKPPGILQGIPVAIKDLEEVKGVRTTHGSRIFENHVSSESDYLVSHIESQGGIIYAKSNTPEFGTGGNTVNKVFGATRNPWDTRMSTAGSSGGAAAALASGTAWLAQGSDMGGSLRNPASFCGIVGLRPTPGRIAENPVSTEHDTLSVTGPMARNVEDVALLFDAMLGYQSSHPLFVPPPEKSFLNVTCENTLPEKVAWSDNLGITPVDGETRRVFLQALGQLEQNGVNLVEAHPDFSGLNDIFHVLRANSYATGLGLHLPDHKNKMNPNVVWNIEEGLKLHADEIIQAERKRQQLINGVQEFFTEFPLIITPATVVPPYPVVRDHVSTCDGMEFKNYYQWLSIAYAFTLALSPALSLPCGFTHSGLPVGMQIAAATHMEAILLSTARHFEDIFNIRDRVPINPNVQHER